MRSTLILQNRVHTNMYVMVHAAAVREKQNLQCFTIPPADFKFGAANMKFINCWRFIIELKKTRNLNLKMIGNLISKVNKSGNREVII